MATMPDSFFSWVVFLLNEYGATLLQGAGVTLLLHWSALLSAV